MRFLRTYFLPLLIAFAMLLFFTHDFGLIDIEHTAIIVAIGVDKNKTDGEYEISTQIAIPQASATSATNNESIITAKGKTIGEAIDKITVNTGWYPLLAFCNLIVIGENSLDGDVMDILNHFIRTDRIPDSAALCACKGSAKDLLLTNTPLDSVSSFALQKILQQDYARFDRIANVNLKTFAEGYFSKSKEGFMPFVKTVKSGDEKKANEKGGENSASGEGLSESGEQSDVYDASETLIFAQGKLVGSLSPEETLLYNLREKNSIDTYIRVNEIEVDGQKTAALLEIDETNKKYGFKFEKGKPVYEIKVSLQCRIVSANAHSPLSDLFPAAEAPENVLKAAESKLTKSLNNLFRKLQITDCDLFEIRNSLYKYHYPKFEKLKDDILRSTTLKTEITCKPKSTTRV